MNNNQKDYITIDGNVYILILYRYKLKIDQYWLHKKIVVFCKEYRQEKLRTIIVIHMHKNRIEQES